MNATEETTKREAHAGKQKPRRGNVGIIVLVACLIIAAGAAIGAFTALSMPSNQPQNQHADASTTTNDELQRQMDNLLVKIEETNTRSDRVQAQLLESNQRNQQLSEQIATLRNRSSNDNQPGIETLRKELASLSTDHARELANKDALIAASQRQLEDARKQNEEIQAQLAKERSLLSEKDQKIANLEKELENVKHVQAKESDKHRLIRQDLELLQIRCAVMQADFERAYLQAHGGGKTSIVAAQNALNKTNLLDRCSQMRKQATTTEKKNLLDKLEAVLTRLTMLDVTGYEAQYSFRSTLESSNVLDQITLILSMPGEEKSYRTLLTEARMILLGADRVE